MLKYILLILNLVVSALISYGQRVQFATISKSDSVEILATWNKFVDGLSRKDANQLREMSLSLIDCSLCVSIDSPPSYINPVQIDTFLNQAFREIYDSPLWEAIKKRKFLFLSKAFPSYCPNHIMIRKGEKFTVYQLFYEVGLASEIAPLHESQMHGFQFVKLNHQFKFYGFITIP